MATGSSHKHYRLIRNNGPQKPSVSGVVKKSDGSLIQSQVCRLQRCTKHFRKRFSWPTETTDLAPLSTNESTQMDASPSSGMEMIREIGVLKRQKAAGLNELSPSFFKDGSEVLTSELTNFRRSVWTRE